MSPTPTLRLYYDRGRLLEGGEEESRRIIEDVFRQLEEHNLQLFHKLDEIESGAIPRNPTLPPAIGTLQARLAQLLRRRVQDDELHVLIERAAAFGGALEWQRLYPESRRSRTVTATGAVRLDDQVVLADATAAPLTLTLPPVGTAKGRLYAIKRQNAGANAVTVVP
jgi:hypothetical protein